MRVIISCMAGGIVPGWRTIEWPGESPPKGGHPSWHALATRARRADGRLLPVLASRWGIWEALEPGGELVVIGYSAGANSGLRELIRHPEDLAACTRVISLDGLHANLKTWLPASSGRGRYFDWAGEMAPLERAWLSGRLTATASQTWVDPRWTTTRQAWWDVTGRSFEGVGSISNAAGSCYHQDEASHGEHAAYWREEFDEAGDLRMGKA